MKKAKVNFELFEDMAVIGRALDKIKDASIRQKISEKLIQLYYTETKRIVCEALNIQDIPKGTKINITSIYAPFELVKLIQEILPGLFFLRYSYRTIPPTEVFIDEEKAIVSIDKEAGSTAL